MGRSEDKHRKGTEMERHMETQVKARRDKETQEAKGTHRSRQGEIGSDMERH